MNKKLLLLLVILLGFNQLNANPVDQATAGKVGQTFSQTAFANISRNDAMNLVKATDAYFVFNIGESGFVIVSADDSFRPIIGYSDEGLFPTENPSPEMMYYLGHLSRGREAALQASDQVDSQVQMEWAALLGGNPMPSRNNRAAFHLVQTKWNQNDPYNKFCPKAEGEGRAYAGCVATAMSQVMNYWQYPTHGYGQHSYTYYQYGELSADFSAAEYNFDLMPNSISNTSPVENIDAVAMFMYHCGIAVDMMYGADGSGAYSYDVPEAEMKYFGYSNRCRYYSRDNYSLEEFQAILKDQFDMGWPCYYSGQDTDGSGGHAYVCDGYDDNDMFHFNWGWSGSGDGFFVIDELNVSGYAFNDDQAIVANFVPSEVFTHTAKAPDLFTAVPSEEADFAVSLSWVNPTATIDGQPLESLDQIVIMRDNIVLQTFDNPIPGEAMSFVDLSGQPVTVNYSIYAVYQGYGGRRAHVNGINLGPTCLWTVNLSSESENGWDGGVLSIVNSSCVKVVDLTTDRRESSYQVEVPQGRIAFRWKAPNNPIEIGIEIMDAEEQTVFAYQGQSSMMPKGIFYEMVNTCGGEGNLLCPSNLRAEVEGNDVILTWNGIPNPGYGYNVYRDGCLYTMVSDTTTRFVDAEMAQEAHSYFVTAFCVEGETYPSNTVCAMEEYNGFPPRNLDAEILENKKIKLTWEKPENDDAIAGYMVYRKALGEAYRRVKVCGATATSYTDSFSVDDGDHYFYKLTAVHRRENVESAPAQSLHNPDLLYVEINRTHIPSGLSLEKQGNQLLLQWDPAMLAESYNVYCNGELLAQNLTDVQHVDTIRDATGLQVYHVTGLLNGVESSPSNKVFYGNYAVGENNLTDMMLFPNPAKDVVTVRAEGLTEVTVFNLTGQLVLSRKVDDNELRMDLTGLGSGVYYFKVSTNQGNCVQKVVLF